MKEKIFIPLYVEHLHFLVTGVGWLVTKIYEHYTFEQAPFKKEFVTMNQNARQKAESSIERDFYQLMSSSNFGIYCINNIDNFKFKPIYHEFGEISLYEKLFGNDKCRDIKIYKDIDQKIKKSIKSKATKMLIDFNCLDCSSIQSFALKKVNFKLTTRFLSAQLLMLVKLSLMSFIYELVKTFYYLHETV